MAMKIIKKFTAVQLYSSKTDGVVNAKLVFGNIEGSYSIK